MDYLKEPKRKRHVHIAREQPFPVVIESVSGIPASERLWQLYTGRYNGDCVVVEKGSDVHSLYTKGFFGKGSMSKNFPTFGKFKNGIPPFISERQWKQRSKWKEALSVEDPNTDESPVKAEENSICVKKEAFSEADCSPTEVMDIDDSSFPPATSHSVPVKEAGPQAFPSDWQQRLEETNSVEHVVTSYRTPTIRFRRDPHSKRSAVMQFCSGSSNKESTRVLLSGNETEGGQLTTDTQAVHIPSNTGSVCNFQTEKNSETERRQQEVIDDTLAKQTVEKQMTYDHVGQGIVIDVATDDIEEEMVTDNASASTNGECPLLESRNQELRLLCRGQRDIGDEVVVLRDSDSEDEELRLDALEARLMPNPCLLPEHLHLTLEEAFFLCYALGCLQVMDLSGRIMTLREVWQTFRTSDEEFVQKYVAYHHFRAKGWVVKSGLKYGGDFLLYKEGPPFYHASYIVLVEVLMQADWSRYPSHNRRSISWPFLFGANRLAEIVAKEILMCRVIWPTSVSGCGPDTPQQLARFCVQEALLKRWVSSQEREELDKEEITE